MESLCQDDTLRKTILRKLEYSDLLRLRRACKPIKIFCDDFIRNNFTSQVREINESTFTLQHFIQANLPTTSIFINNTSPAFFTDPLIPTFVIRYGKQITHVRIRHFTALVSGSELFFFSNLPNIVHLDITFIDATQRDCYSKTWDSQGVLVRMSKSPFPRNFKNLRTLKLNEIRGSRNEDHGYFEDFVEFCEDLEYVKHPLYKHKSLQFYSHPFQFVKDYIRRRHENYPNLPNLQFYDLAHETRGEGYLVRGDRNIFEISSAHQVQLVNVRSNLVRTQRNAFPARNILKLPPFADTLVSLINVYAVIFSEELRNLEKLVIHSLRESSYAEAWKWLREPGGPVEQPKWPNLKTLDITIDASRMSGGSEDNLVEAEAGDFLNYLFASPAVGERGKLRELGIRYSAADDESLPGIRVKNITETCPFVTKLMLVKWKGGSGEMTKFWEGLPLLEELELNGCVELGNSAFLGKEKGDPVFLKLKYLKKMSLKGMDKMVNLTDLAFRLVFSRLKIKQFCLTSRAPLESVTVAGLESLVTGDFNKYVEKFPFTGWSLDGVSEEAFNELKMKFRATHMN